jgi:hypothetical protein
MTQLVFDHNSNTVLLGSARATGFSASDRPQFLKTSPRFQFEQISIKKPGVKS